MGDFQLLPVQLSWPIVCPLIFTSAVLKARMEIVASVGSKFRTNVFLNTVVLAKANRASVSGGLRSMIHCASAWDGRKAMELL